MRFIIVTQSVDGKRTAIALNKIRAFFEGDMASPTIIRVTSFRKKPFLIGVIEAFDEVAAEIMEASK